MLTWFFKDIRFFYLLRNFSTSNGIFNPFPTNTKFILLIKECSSMILTTYVSIGWLIAGLFWWMPKRLTFLEHLILWFSCSFVIVSLRTIFTLNLGWIEVEESKQLFLTYLFRRSFIDPMLLLILANLILRAKGVMWKLLAVISILMTYILLEYGLVQLNVIQFVKFNYLYFAGMYLFFILFSLLIVYLLQRGGSSHEDFNI
jgi:hypothetical protein